jgi:hypothetical protein
MRRTVAVSITTAIIALCAAGTGAAATDTAAYTGPTHRHTKADMAKARYVMLRPDDVFSNFRRSSQAWRLPKVFECGSFPGNLSAITITGEAKSAFQYGGQSIAATVMWFKNGFHIDDYWKRIVRARFLSCSVQHLELETENGTVIRPRITFAKEIPMEPTGANAAVAYRYIGRIPSGGGYPTMDWIETNAFIQKGLGIAHIRTIWLDHPCECHNDVALRLARRMFEARA